MKLRTSDLSYLAFVDIWYSKVLAEMRPLLYINGGPIIMVQVENEYGDFEVCDRHYLSWLAKKTASYLVDEVLLFTTDNNRLEAVSCGKIEGIYATVDFGAGADVKAAFQVQRSVEKKGPLVVSEFYAGWLDHWSEKHETIAINDTVDTLRQVLALNASVNM